MENKLWPRFGLSGYPFYPVKYFGPLGNRINRISLYLLFYEDHGITPWIYLNQCPDSVGNLKCLGRIRYFVNALALVS